MSELESSTSQCTSYTSSKTEALKLVELTNTAAHPSKPPSMEVNVKQLRFLAGLQDAVQDLVSGKPLCTAATATTHARRGQIQMRKASTLRRRLTSSPASVHGGLAFKPGALERNVLQPQGLLLTSDTCCGPTDSLTQGR